MLDLAAVAGLAAVLAFPVLAMFSVPALPKLADPAVALPALRTSPAGKALRAVPIFSQGGAAATAVADGAVLTDRGAMGQALDAESAAVFGPGGDGGLSALVADQANSVFSTSDVSEATIEYPYRFPSVDRILDAKLGTGAVRPAQLDAVDDLAGLLVLAAARFPAAFPNAGSVAYDLYDRARRADGCDAQLNLAFLLSTDTNPRDDDTADEFHRAAKDCPGDPTPLWLLGQFQSGRATGTPLSGQSLPPAERQKRALATFSQLESQFPGSALGWSGEADTRMRIAYSVDVGQPFTARAGFRRALALYQRAEGLDDDAGLAAGEARASAGLGQFAAAARAQRRALDEVADAAPFQVRLVDYLERDHRFADAADANGGFLAKPSAFPIGPGLIAQGSVFDDELFFEDGLGPLSIGTERFLPVQLVVGPPPGGAGAAATDLSFIPLFREAFGVTGVDRWCREWSHRRDLVLAGRASQALEGLPTSFLDSRPERAGTTCEDDQGLLRAVATLEAGDRRGAVDGFRPADVNGDAEADPVARLVTILDADQNMWRFAGQLDRAAAASKAWIAAAPDDPLAHDRAGEIAFLDKDFRAAADAFAAAAKLATKVQLADEQLKQGTALELGGDLAQARKLLQLADATASKNVPGDLTQAEAEGDETALQAVLDSYLARAQAGDTELRARDYEAAEQYYRAARDRERQLPQPDQVPGTMTLRREQLFRPEVLENNESLVLVQLERPDDAVGVARKAVAFDPADPLFLQNLGFAQQKSGDLDGAADSYRAALASDPTNFPAANDLGVVLAEQHDWIGAADAFRQALAANHKYATARFNLGLALDRMGPAHAVESQGQLAEAIRTDSTLRNQNHTFISDDDVFFTTLDLSKPVPPDWHFATSTKRAPITAATIVIALLLFRLVKALAVDKVSDAATERMLHTSRHGRLSRFAHLGSQVPGAVAVIATVAVFVYPLTQSSGTTLTDIALLGIGIAVTTLAFMRLRTAMARREQITTRHYTWIPALVVGGAAAALGVGYAPLPATDDEEGSLPRAARWVGTAVLGLITLVLLVAGRLTEVPLTSDLGAVCLVMTSSALTPVEPYDGAFLEEEGHTGLLIAVGLAAVGVLLYLGVL